MNVNSPLIAILVLALGLAFVFGAIANRLRFSPIVGYLFSGVAVGSIASIYATDTSLAPQLADVGIILLMFGVGLHFSPQDLLALRKVVIPGAVTQSLAAALLGMGLAWFAGFSLGASAVFGMSLSIASTVVLTRTLNDRHLMDTERGHIAVGWLIVQDIVTVLGLVLLPPLTELLTRAETGALVNFSIGGLFGALILTVGKLGVFAALVLAVGRRLIPLILHYVAHTGSRELFRLAVLSLALGVAYTAAQFFGVSFALGAFFGGLALSESQLSQRAAEESLPLRDAFAVLYFVSVGMLFNPAVLLSDSLFVAATLAVVIIGNAGFAYLLLRRSGRTKGDALLIAVGLAQIGEFSYILADLGIGLGVLTAHARDVILGVSILSIVVNPFLFSYALSFRAREEAARAGEGEVRAPKTELQPTSLTGHAVLIGYGRVGQLVGETLVKEGWRIFVIEDAADVAERLRAQGIEIVSGNAADEKVLGAANLAAAKLLFVAIPNAFEAGQIVQQARSANPKLEIAARAHFDAEVEYLKRFGADEVIMGEREIAHAMLDYARQRKAAASA